MTDRAWLGCLRIDIAIVGVGDTDYADDYARAHSGAPYEDCYGYAALAFNRALADCGFRSEDVDGLIVGPTLSGERTGEILGLNPLWSSQADAINAILQATFALGPIKSRGIRLVYLTSVNRVLIDAGPCLLCKMHLS